MANAKKESSAKVPRDEGLDWISKKKKKKFVEAPARQPVFA